MNTTTGLLADQYVMALEAHVAHGPEASSAPATRLGRKAMQAGLGAVELAQIHEQALVALMLRENPHTDGNETIRQAGTFFRQALAPLAEVSRAAHHGNVPAQGPEKRASAAELNAANKRLQRETAKRKAAESALEEERLQYGKLLAESEVMQRELRHLSHEILRAQEEERKKISRELHDEISQILTGINVRLAALRIESTANAEDISEKIARTQRLVEKSVATVHRFARELRPALLDDLGLIPALTAYLKEVRKRTGLQIHLTASKDATIETMDSLKRTVLYRIAQEALKNIEKHAQASLVNVCVETKPDHVLMEIVDNGKSFSVPEVLSSKRLKRLGLIGMRERAEMLDGTFQIKSKPGTGTTVRVRIPLQAGSGE